MSKPRLIFLHIPKSGGSTLRKWLHKRYAPEQIYKIESDINGDIERFLELPAAAREDIHLVTGHMAYGLHRALPEANYITFVREPVQRVISEYTFIRSNPYHVLHDSVKAMTLMAYLDCGLSSQISNGQTRLIAGVCQAGRTGIPSNREITDKDYHAAVKNLNQDFILPSTLDYYDETLLLWASDFNWPLPFYLRENVTPGKRYQPTTAETAKIKQMNQWDIKLYGYVKAAMAERLRVQPLRFRLVLAMFKKANWLYAKATAATRLLKAKLA